MDIEEINTNKLFETLNRTVKEAGTVWADRGLGLESLVKHRSDFTIEPNW